MVSEKGGKRCVLDPSTRELPISDLHAKGYSQFGERVHIAPESTVGYNHMRTPDGGWVKAPRDESGLAWGRGVSGQSR
eukprot:8079449-Karenia_brevis.AAC.1